MRRGGDAVVGRHRPVLRQVAAAGAGEGGAEPEEGGQRDEVPHREEAEAVWSLIEGRVGEQPEAP